MMDDFLNKQIEVDEIELTARSLQSNVDCITGSPAGESDVRKNESTLLPVDRGFAAWSFLAAAFIIEGVLWGLPSAYGVFLTAYLADPLFASQNHASTLLPLSGTLASGIMCCSAIVVNPVMARYPRHRRTGMWAGLLVCWASLFGGSYATKVSVLVVLQGVTYAVGGALLCAPYLHYLSEWFVERRGLANGVTFAGTAAAGIAFPLLLPPLISKYGPSKTLRIASFMFVGMVAPAVPFIRGRLPEARARGLAARSSNRIWLTNWTFWFFATANALQGVAYYIPMVWLPTFASSLGLSAGRASLALALLNGASLIGRLLMGLLSDRFNPWALGVLSAVLTSVATFVLWGVLAHSQAGILCYGVAYGSLAGGWSTLWTSFIRPLAKEDPTLATSIFGFMMLISGIGSILSTPISSALQSSAHAGRSTVVEAGTGYAVADGQYARMIVYVGACFAGVSVLMGAGWGMERVRPLVKLMQD